MPPCPALGATPEAGGGMTHARNADAAELGKFDASASSFWDPQRRVSPAAPVESGARAVSSPRAPHLPGARVLDVGCGGGLLAEALARAGAQVTGHRSGAGHDRGRAAARRRSRLAIDYRVAAGEQLRRRRPGASMSSPAWRCSSTCPIRQRWSRPSPRWCARAGRCSSPPSTATCAVLPAGHRRRPNT